MELASSDLQKSGCLAFHLACLFAKLAQRQKRDVSFSWGMWGIAVGLEDWVPLSPRGPHVLRRDRPFRSLFLVAVMKGLS